jgi:hypothetical protein
LATSSAAAATSNRRSPTARRCAQSHARSAPARRPSAIVQARRHDRLGTNAVTTITSHDDEGDHGSAQAGGARRAEALLEPGVHRVEHDDQDGGPPERHEKGLDHQEHEVQEHRQRDVEEHRGHVLAVGGGHQQLLMERT